jgi:hypothetical protein
MNIGIVGAEGAKFTKLGETRANKLIFDILYASKAETGEVPFVISGECHLGGIDIWARDIALNLKIGYKGYPPKLQRWEGGYKQRNLQIVANSDK